MKAATLGDGERAARKWMKELPVDTDSPPIISTESKLILKLIGIRNVNELSRLLIDSVGR